MLMPERSQDRHSAALGRLAAGGSPRVIGRILELTAKRKDGAEFPIELSLSTWRSRGRASFGGIIRDLSARKDAETRAILAAVVEGSDDAIIAVSLDRITP